MTLTRRRMLVATAALAAAPLARGQKPGEKRVLGVLSPHPQLLQYMLLAGGAYALFLAFDGGDVNADLPAQWLMYIVVEDAEAAAAKCRELGGEVVVGVRALGEGRFCVIRDPAGAVCALYEP